MKIRLNTPEQKRDYCTDRPTIWVNLNSYKMLFRSMCLILIVNLGEQELLGGNLPSENGNFNRKDS